MNKPTEIQLHGISKQAMQAIIDFAYTRSTEITAANVTEIIAVAHYFGMSRLEHICTNFIKNMLTPENVILLWLELRLAIRECSFRISQKAPNICHCGLRFRYNLYKHELDVITKTYILRNFIEIVAKSEHIWKLPFDIFHEIINDDRLNVKAEEPVWECCLRWIDADVESRKVHTPELLQAIRLGLMGLEVS